MKSIFARCVGFVLLGAVFVSLNARSQATNPVTPEKLDAFMTKWGEYKPFQTPVDPADEPLLLAALKKVPTGPWGTYISMKFANDQFEGRKANRDRVAYFKSTLRYLEPAQEIVASALKSEPTDVTLRSELANINQAVALASLEAGVNLEKTKGAALAMLAGNDDPKDWNYGNVVFQANATLGRIALREGKMDDAKKYLLAAGKTPGSPQLNSFGPTFILARELLQKDQKPTVLEFLNLVERFYANPAKTSEANAKRVATDHQKTLEMWRAQIRDGKIPDGPSWQ